MTITEEATKNIIRKLLKGEDYRMGVLWVINAEFLRFMVNFFKKIIEAKLRNEDISIDWYKKEFLNPNLSADEIAINAGLNRKTIHNVFNSSTRKIVIDASNEHYETLYQTIKSLLETERELELTLTIKFRGVSVDLNVSESLIAINTLAVKRAEIRGGLWSTAGKRVEKPLMQVLCGLYGVPRENYAIKIKNRILSEVDFEREVDFYLIDTRRKEYRCEVKLMGKGNPESADAVIARDSRVFVADKLSETNKKQLDSRGVKWVEMRAINGFRRFETILQELQIPHRGLGEDFEDQLNKIFSEIFEEKFL